MESDLATDNYTEGMGERIRWIRVQNNLSQGDLGNILGVSRQSISGYETERMVPSRAVIHKMCRIYGADPAWVYYGIGERVSGFKEIPKQGALTPAQDALIALIKENSEIVNILEQKLWGEGLDAVLRRDSQKVPRS